MDEIVFKPAKTLARWLRARKLSRVEVIKAFIAQVERVNPKVNAIVTFLPEQALAEAKRMDARARRSPESIGPLEGLPIAFKDTFNTRGIRTTFGSPIYANNVPAEDSAMVERVKAAGAITLGKTNTPEFAAGSQTFNTVFGTTRNPYDLDKTCGGSSVMRAAMSARGGRPAKGGWPTSIS